MGPVFLPGIVFLLEIVFLVGGAHPTDIFRFLSVF